MSSFAKNLRQLRKTIGMTQDNLAQKMNVTRQAISAWERGCTEPDIQTLITLAEVLNVDANELLFGRNAVQKPAIQKRDVMLVTLSFSITLIIFILQFTLYPYLLNLQKEQLLPYAFSYRQIVPPIGYIASGLSLLSFISLFYNIKIGKRWRLAFLFSAIILSAPSILSMLEEALWLLVPNYSMPFSSLIIRPITRNPSLKTVLFKICPFLSGIFIFFGRDRKCTIDVNGGG